MLPVGMAIGLGPVPLFLFATLMPNLARTAQKLQFILIASVTG